MRLFLPTRLSVIGATARLLFATHPRAFITSAVGSLIEPLFYPALLLILHQMLQAITGPVGSVQLSGTVAVSSIELVALLLIQRLALARLLYHDAPLLMLDEPSASLDPVGERQIFELLAHLSREKIILFATHRYDTIRQADTIAVLVDGQLAEMGTHDELERNAREFWSLYLAQSSSPVVDSSPS